MRGKLTSRHKTPPPTLVLIETEVCTSGNSEWDKEVRTTLVYFVCSVTHTCTGRREVMMIHTHTHTTMHAHRHCSGGHIEVNVKEDLVFSGAQRLINTDLERTAGGRGGHTHKANRSVCAHTSSKKNWTLFFDIV